MGDSAAIKQQLADAGIPARSVMKSATGVVVGKTQAGKAKAALAQGREEANSLLDDRDHAASVLQGAPVAVLRGDEAPASGGMSALREWATALFAAAGGMAKNPRLGDVTLDQRAVRDSLGHGINKFKAAAFAAVGDVLAKGVVIAEGKTGDRSSYYVSAPVVIGGVDDVVTVLVHRDEHTQRMYLHSVTTKENLLQSRVSSSSSSTDASAKHSGPLSAGDVGSVLRELLTSKTDTQPILTSQSADELKAKTEREDAATKAAAAKKAAEQERLRREAEARDNKARADSTVDDFQLGQSADQQLSGITDMFSPQADPGAARSDEAGGSRPAPAITAPTGKPAPDKGARRLTDAGEELIGNRRSKLKGLAWDDVSAMNDTLKVAQVTKSNVWPRPDYAKMVEDGAPAWKAAALKAVYDKLAAAPATRAAPTDADLKAYIETMHSVRDALTAELDRVQAAGGGDDLRVSLKADNVFGKVFPLPTDVRSAYGRPSAFDRTSEQGKDNNRRALLIGGNGAIQPLQFTGRTLAKVNELLADGFPAKQEAWQKSYEVRPVEMRDSDVPETERTGQPQQRFAVYEKGSRFRLAKGMQDGGYATQEQAEAFARTLTSRKREVQPPSRGLDLAGVTRTGPDWRGGKDVTADQVMAHFGFRGVNLGEYVKAKQDVAQLHLNHVFDAFSDLADILGVQPKAMSLGGTLGVAIGAQGGGKALAHFMPGVNEINITRDAGAGALAHELGHALDHYFAAQHGRAVSMAKRPYLSAVVDTLRDPGGVRPEVMDAMRQVMKALNSRPMTEAEARKYMDDQRAMNQQRFDRWVKEFKGNKGADLAALDAVAEKLKRGDVGEPSDTDVESNLAEFMRASGLKPGAGIAASAFTAAYRLRDLADEARFMASHIPQVATNFSKASDAMDAKKSGGEGYWSTPWEKFARAFETFAKDALQDRRRESLYLSGLVDSAGWHDWAASTGKNIPYPSGPERLDMQQAFQKLVDTIETREDDAGNVAMFSVQGESGQDLPLLSRGLRDGVSGGIGGGILGIGENPSTFPRPSRATIRAVDLNVVVALNLKGWRGIGLDNIVAVDHWTGLPQEILDDAKKRGFHAGAVEGVAFRDKVYLVRSNLRDVEHAQRVLFHEALGHLGVKAALAGRPTTTLNALWDKLNGLAGVAKLAKGIEVGDGSTAWDRLQPYVQGTQEDVTARRSMIVDELIAFLAQANDTSALTQFKAYMADVKGAIVALLRRLDLNGLADQLDRAGAELDVLQLVRDARRAIQRGKTRDGEAFTLVSRAPNPAFSKSDEVPQAAAFKTEALSTPNDEGARNGASAGARASVQQDRRDGDQGMAFSVRDDRPVALPDVIVANSLAATANHPDYVAAKAGDIAAAVRLAGDLVTPDLVAKVRAAYGSDIIVQPVTAEEAAGRNKIPLAGAKVLARDLGASVGLEVVQGSRAHRTAMDGLGRLFASPEFIGDVVPGGRYLLLDDTLTQGGTFASLASHIQQNGGTVVGAVALTGKQYSAKLQLSPELLGQVRETYSDVEPAFRAATGRGFDALTESEARYLAKHKSPDDVRGRIAAAGRQAGSREDGRDAQGPQGLNPSAASGDDADAVFSVGSAVPPEKQLSKDALEALVRREAPTADAWKSIQVVDGPGAIGVVPPAGVVPSGVSLPGKIYLFRDGIVSEAEAIRTIFHELFHLGLSQSMGQDAYVQRMLRMSSDPLVQQYASRWKRSADGVARKGAMPVNNWHALAVEESLADIAEELHADRQGIGTRGNIPQFVRTAARWLADMLRHQMNPGHGVSATQGAARVFKSFVGSWIPVSDVAPSFDNARGVAMIGVPDALDPLVEPLLNMNSFGKQLYPEGFGQDKMPDSEKVFAGQKGTFAHGAARFINSATGGSQYHEGFISLTPATINNVIRGYGGGVASFVTSIADTTATRGIDRDRTEWWRAPFVKQLYGEVDRIQDQALAYDRLGEIEKSAEPMRRALKAGDREAAQAIVEDAGQIAKLGPVATAAREQLTRIRKHEIRVMG